MIVTGLTSPISVLRISSSGNFWLLGTENGSVRICKRSPSEDQLKISYWERCIHDGQYGRVAGIGLSSNDKHLLSVSADTTFYVQVLIIFLAQYYHSAQLNALEEA